MGDIFDALDEMYVLITHLAYYFISTRLKEECNPCYMMTSLKDVGTGENIFTELSSLTEEKFGK